MIEFKPKLLPYKSQNKWGFCRPDKQVVIPCLFDTVGEFSNGIVKVCLNNKFGFYHDNGREIIPCIIDEFTYGWGEDDYDVIEDFTDKIKYVIVLIQEGKYLLDKEGNLYEYDWLGYERDNNHFHLGIKLSKYIEVLGHWSEVISIEISIL